MAGQHHNEEVTPEMIEAGVMEAWELAGEVSRAFLVKAACLVMIEVQSGF